MTIQELKKVYNLSDEQMEKIRDAMDFAYKAIQLDGPDCQSIFEHKIAEIVGAVEGDWHVAEEFALAFYSIGKWVDVFSEFYGSDLQYKDIIKK